MYIIIIIILLLLFTIYLLILSYKQNDMFTTIDSGSAESTTSSDIPICDTSNLLNDNINDINYNCPYTMCKFTDENLTYTKNFIFDYMFKMINYPLCVVIKYLTFIDIKTLNNSLNKYELKFSNLTLKDYDLFLGIIINFSMNMININNIFFNAIDTHNIILLFYQIVISYYTKILDNIYGVGNNYKNIVYDKESLDKNKLVIYFINNPYNNYYRDYDDFYKIININFNDSLYSSNNNVATLISARSLNKEIKVIFNIFSNPKITLISEDITKINSNKSTIISSLSDTIGYYMSLYHPITRPIIKSIQNQGSEQTIIKANGLDFEKGIVDTSNIMESNIIKSDIMKAGNKSTLQSTDIIKSDIMNLGNKITLQSTDIIKSDIMESGIKSTLQSTDIIKSDIMNLGNKSTLQSNNMEVSNIMESGNKGTLPSDIMIGSDIMKPGIEKTISNTEIGLNKTNDSQYKIKYDFIMGLLKSNQIVIPNSNNDILIPTSYSTTTITLSNRITYNNTEYTDFIAFILNQSFIKTLGQINSQPFLNYTLKEEMNGISNISQQFNTT